MNPVFNPQRKFGVELEVCIDENCRPEDICEYIMYHVSGMTIDTGRVDEYYPSVNPIATCWEAKSDSSISPAGFELVSPPLAGEDGLRELQDVVDTLSARCYANSSCGLHVHHNIMDFSDEQFVNLYKVYYSLSPVIAFMLPPSRRYNSYCGPLNTSLKRLKNDAKTQKDFILGEPRQALNLAPCSGRNTAEFRQHEGTVNSTDIIAWIFLTQRIVEYAKITRKPKDSREKSLSKLFFRLGWTKSALEDARVRWVRAYWEERFAYFTGNEKEIPISIGKEN